MSNKFLKDLYDAAEKQGVKRDMVDNALELGRKMCGHVLRQYLCLIAEGCGDEKLHATIIKSFPDCDTVGAQKISFKEHLLTLVLKFGIVEKDAVNTIQTDPKYITEIFKNMDRLVNLMQSHFRTVMELNPLLRRQLCEAIGVSADKEKGIEFVINKYNRNMYLVNELEKQIGVVMYYEDSEGNIVTEITEEKLFGARTN